MTQHKTTYPRRCRFSAFLRGTVLCILTTVNAAPSNAKDYIVTIGGGYEPAGNQASLEANVLFFRDIVAKKYSTPIEHMIFFADGDDTTDDLQIITPRTKPDSPAVELLKSVFALDRPQISYRNHEVPDIRGPLSPNSVREGIEDVSKRLTSGDRLIVYVTAHGSAGSRDDRMNTSIMCWQRKPINVRMLSNWLDNVPQDVPVILVMAQCYCGGFANTLFEGGKPENGLSKGIRVGFFAQRHDLPAAGCRPDIENDEEYSSYFWGAFLGQSRTGKPAEGADTNHDGKVSFLEAHAYAVQVSTTIDIPLRSSDTLLRQFSRIRNYKHSDAPVKSSTAAPDAMDKASEPLETPKPEESETSTDKSTESTEIENEAETKDSTAESETTNNSSGPEAKSTDSSSTESETDDDPRLAAMSGTLAEILEIATAEQRFMIESLSTHLELPPTTTVEEILKLAKDQSERMRQSRQLPGRRGPPAAGPGRRGQRNSVRRDLQKQIVDQWPELKEPEEWNELSWLNSDEADSFLAKVRELPNYEPFTKSLNDRRIARENATKNELKSVQFRRLVHSIETVILAKNLPIVASPDVVQRYRNILDLEATYIGDQ